MVSRVAKRGSLLATSTGQADQLLGTLFLRMVGDHLTHPVLSIGDMKTQYLQCSNGIRRCALRDPDRCRGSGTRRQILFLQSTSKIEDDSLGGLLTDPLHSLQRSRIPLQHRGTKLVLLNIGEKCQRTGGTDPRHLADSIEEITLFRMSKAKHHELFVTDSMRDEQPCSGSILQFPQGTRGCTESMADPPYLEHSVTFRDLNHFASEVFVHSPPLAVCQVQPAIG